MALDKGEMSFAMFDYSSDLDTIVAKDQRSVDTLAELSKKIGNDALPTFLIDYIKATSDARRLPRNSQGFVHCGLRDDR